MSWRAFLPPLEGPPGEGESNSQPIRDSNFKQRENMRPHSRGAMRPRLASVSPSWRTEGAGKAGCRSHPRSCAKKRTSGPQVQPDHSGFPRTMVYGLLRALLGEPSSFATVALRMTDASGPGRVDTSPQNLTPASGARTTRLRRPRPSPPKVLPDLVPSGEFRRRRAAAPFVRAPVDRSRKNPPCNPVCARRCRVHRIPPRVRDDSRSARCRVRRANL